jgi:hypothetical protein
MIEKIKNDNTWIISISIVIILLFAIFVQTRIRPIITGRIVGPYGEPAPPKPPSCFHEWTENEGECYKHVYPTGEEVYQKKITLIPYWPEHLHCEGELPDSRTIKVECEPEVPEPEPKPEEYLGPTEIQASTEIDYPSSFDSSILTSTSIDITITNNGGKSIKNIDIEIGTPQKTESFPPYTGKISKNWKSGMTGFAALSTLSSRLLQWNTSLPQHYDEIRPNETIQTSFTISTPITDSEQKELHLIISSNNYTVYNETISAILDVPQFLVIPDIREGNILDIYMLILNAANEDKRFNIEFNLDKHTSLPKTILAEYYGPYTIKANDIKIAAYKYKYDYDFAGSEYLLKAMLYEKGRRIAESTYKLDLKDKLTSPVLEKPISLTQNKLTVLLTLTLLVLVLIVFISTYGHQRRKDIHEKRKEQHIISLNTFFAKAIKRGHTKESIKKMLINKLWPEDIVIRYCDKIFKDIESKIKKSFKK